VFLVTKKYSKPVKAAECEEINLDSSKFIVFLENSIYESKIGSYLYPGQILHMIL
jgi:hypothetical protein